VAPFNPGPSLVVTCGTGLARQIPVPFRGIVLGRDAQLGPPFSTDEFVSRSHVWVRRRGDGVVEVTDLGSANGTYVNGMRVRAPTRMQDSDVLRIGRIYLKLAAPPGDQNQATATGEGASAAETGPHLTIVNPAALSGRRFYLSGDDLVVGRDPASGIQIDDPHISWIHAAVRRRGEAVYVQDLGSSSGTFVNGQTVTAAHVLQPGDIVAFAGVCARFDQPAEVAGA
jgi:pSer/pThr/pTyr-binding forkhead associated (FHA) protein